VDPFHPIIAGASGLLEKPPTPVAAFEVAEETPITAPGIDVVANWKVGSFCSGIELVCVMVKAPEVVL
jgi:hypothetical protein